MDSFSDFAKEEFPIKVSDKLNELFELRYRNKKQILEVLQYNFRWGEDYLYTSPGNIEKYRLTEECYENLKIIDIK